MSRDAEDAKLLECLVESGLVPHGCWRLEDYLEVGISVTDHC